MLIKAAINGNRTRKEHPAVPVTPEQQAEEAAAAVASGAGAIHVHVRDTRGRESLKPQDVAVAVQAIRAGCPGIPVGISTGAWIAPEVQSRLSFINAWNVLPDFASVNIHEAGALQVVRLLLERRVGVEAGVWTARAAEILADSNLAEACLRILIEPAEGPGNAQENLVQIEAVLQGIGRPRLLHGLGVSAWEFVRLAAERKYDTRTGFEDTLLLPDGSLARSNAELVMAARRIVAEVNSQVNEKV